MPEKCSEDDCEHESVNGYVYCGKHLGYGQDNYDEEDPSFCTNHPNHYAVTGYTICGCCLGYGDSCLDDPDVGIPASEYREIVKNR